MMNTLERGCRLQLPLLAILLFVGVAGCAKPSAYKAPVSKFRDASTVVIQSTKVYLTELNKVERNQYIYSQASKPEQIKLDEIEKVQVFSKEGIVARLNALDQLANYVDLLNQLANSSTPQTIKTKASDLQTSLTNLSGQIKALTGEDDKQFKGVAEKVLPVIGDLLQAFAEQAIENALKKAIATGAEPVNQLIQAIEQDATVAYERKRSGSSAARVILVDQYNREFEKGKGADAARLKAFADAISAGEDRWEAFLTAQPTDGLEAMKRANQALVKFAATPKPNITDFASFVDAMDSFANAASRVGRVVQELLGK
jgi:PBP1b-binding outer membrane lipoprotein LpoB